MELQRQAIIIHANDEKIGTKKDFQNMYNFLRSPLGGSWNSNEISEELSRQCVINKIRQITEEIDYLFIVFTGHGSIDKNNEYHLKVSDGIITLNELLKAKAKRKTIIIDSCRSYSEEVSSYTQIVSENLNLINNTRTIFDDAISVTQNGLNILYSASKGQFSRGGENGGLYLNSLLKSAEEWKLSKKSTETVTNTKIINDAAIKNVKKSIDLYRYDFNSNPQTPEIVTDKNNNYFPFATCSVLSYFQS